MKSPAFQFYANDWLSSPTVMLMSPAEEGAYIRLLAIDWACDGIPDNDEVLAKLSRLNEGWFNGCSTVVKQTFIQHPNKPSFLTNKRLQFEREKQEIFRHKCSDAGKKSAASRYKSSRKKTLKVGSILVEPKLNSSSSSSSSSSNTSKEVSDWSNVVPFKTEKFLISWNKWVQFRIEKKNRLTPTQIQNQFSEMKEWGEEESIARIEKSITNGWAGLFEIKKSTNLFQKSPMQSARIEEKIEIKELSI